MDFFLKIQTEEALPNSFCKAHIFLIPREGKDTAKGQADIPDKQSTLNKNIYLESHSPW